MTDSPTNAKPAGKVGFTITELMVAAVITSMVLMSVYGLFGRTLAFERGVSQPLRDRAAARAIADHIEAAASQVVNLPNVDAIDSTAGLVTLTVSGSAELGDDAVCRVPHRRQYLFGGGRLHVRVLPLAGTRKIADVPDADDLSDAELWARVPVRLVARGVAAVSIRYKDLTDRRGWRDRWKGPVGQMGIHISVRVGGATVGRTVIPSARGTVTW